MDRSPRRLGDPSRSLNGIALIRSRGLVDNPYQPPDHHPSNDRSFAFRIDILFAFVVGLGIIGIASDGFRSIPLLHLFLVPIPLCLIAFHKAIANLPTWVSAPTKAVESYAVGWAVLVVLGTITGYLEWWPVSR